MGMAPNEAEAVSLLRPELLRRLGEDGGDPVVLAYADSLAKRYLVEPSSVDPSLVGAALDLSALHGDAALFDAYRSRFEDTRRPEDRERFLSALGCFRDSALVDRALGYVLAGPLRPQELFTIPRKIGQSPRYEGRPWEWIQAGYDAFTSRIPAMLSIYLPYFAAGCSTERLEQARRFFADPKRAAPGTEREIAKLEQGVADCASLREREGAAVADYLRRSAGAP
jgi:hypothetical protein